MSRIQPIVGKLRKRVGRDIVLSLTAGTVIAYAYWNSVHVPRFKEYDAYFKQVQEELNAEKQQ